MRRLLKQFLELEASSGIILFFAALLAMLWANSPLATLQQAFRDHFLFIINEGLMAVFFLVVGLELKRGYLEGHLSSRSQIVLPAAAALGGMIVPALLYLAVTAGDALAMQGWSTPVATDIAFALGVLSLFGKRVPSGLKLFLLALAIFDDIGAIFIIGVFYSHGLSIIYLLLAVMIVVALYLLKRKGILSLLPYLLLGALLWVALLFSGVHPTIGGVVLALMIPDKIENGSSALHRLEECLHPWVAYLIMPLFALANAGFSIMDITADTGSKKIALGIMLGLVIGKQVGVFGSSWILIKNRLAVLPDKVSWYALYGVSILCGIGFTMSLFLGTLSFQHHAVYLSDVRYGVMAGSVLSGLLGAAMLLFAFNRETKTT